MLFISPHPDRQHLGVIQPKDVFHPATGQYIGQEGGLDVEFRHGGAPDWAAEIALANPRFHQVWNSLPDDQDRRTMIGTYDTVKMQREHDWDEDTRKLVEDELLNSPFYGISWILAESPETDRLLPWPSYNEAHHFQVVKIAKEIGVDLNDVLAFERENRKRESVIEALEKELNVQEDLVVA